MGGWNRMQRPNQGYCIGKHYRRLFHALNSIAFTATAVLLLNLLTPVANAADDVNGFVLERENRTIVLEPYGPNMIRVTLRITKPLAVAPPGYGIIGKPSSDGWTHEQDSSGYDLIRSDRMTIRVAPANLPAPHAMPLDSLNQQLRDRVFYDEHPRPEPHNDVISITTSSGKPLLTMWRWMMSPNQPEAGGSKEKQETLDSGYRVSAIFDSPTVEHYYGLGQHQQGTMDLRDHRITCWHEYFANVGEYGCVPL